MIILALPKHCHVEALSFNALAGVGNALPRPFGYEPNELLLLYPAVNNYTTLFQSVKNCGPKSQTELRFGFQNRA